MTRWIAALLIAVTMTGCASLPAPRSTPGSVAYAGSTLQAVEETAAAQYRHMRAAQVAQVHRLIVQAQAARDAAVAAINAHNDSLADQRLQTVNTLVSRIQAALNEYRHDPH